MEFERQIISEYFHELAREQLNMLKVVIDEYITTGRKIREQTIHSILGKILCSPRYNKTCYKTPYCGSNEELNAIGNDGTIYWCPHLRDSKTQEIMQYITHRVERCCKCPISSLCLSICGAILPGIETTPLNSQVVEEYFDIY